MRRSLWCAVLAVVLVSLGAVPASAQETGTPIFKSPYRAFTNHEFGASLSDPEGASFAIEGFYTYGRGQNDFGVRGGIVDLDGGTSYVVGGNFRTQVLSYNEDIPVDGALTVGLGAILGDGEDVVLVPVGVSLGRRLQLENSNTTFVPFVHPVIVPTFGGGDDDVNFALGLGVNVNLSENLSVRASGGIGDIEGVGVSLAFVR